jgi:hypothetical protein
MANRVSFSGEEQSLEDIAHYYAAAESGLFGFFAGNSQALLDHYADVSLEEARDKALSELGYTSSLSVLSSVEAAIRVDYLWRVYDRRPDSLSRAMKQLHRAKENRASLEEDLLFLWRNHSDVSGALISGLIGAFKYRHWLAHGRYWTPRFGRQYDFATVFEIAEEFIDAMDAYNGRRGRG